MNSRVLAIGAAVAVAALAIGAGAAGPEAVAEQVAMDADGVQRVAIVGGSYFFRPERIVVRAGQPLEISVSMEAGIVPHRFVIEGVDGHPLVDVALGQLPKVLRMNLKAGDYRFHCPNQLLGFKSHRERGMAGVLEVRE